MNISLSWQNLSGYRHINLHTLWQPVKNYSDFHVDQNMFKFFVFIHFKNYFTKNVGRQKQVWYITRSKNVMPQKLIITKLISNC